MGDQHNANIPAMGDQISADIPYIKDNLEFHKDALERILQTWSDSDNSAQKLDSGVGFNDGTYNYEFPTNQIAAHSVIMLGNSSTIVWMYLNAAPPGWKVTATGKDTVLAVYADSGDYAVEGGNPDDTATWTISGLSHNHQWYKYDDDQGDDDQLYDSAGDLALVGNHAKTSGRHIDTNINPGKAPLDAYTKLDDTQDGGWRPKASVGKLYQLDTA